MPTKEKDRNWREKKNGIIESKKAFDGNERRIVVYAIFRVKKFLIYSRMVKSELV